VSRVLVTGAGGFIGRHTLAPLIAAGHEVHAVSSRPAAGGTPIGVPEVHWHHADLLVPGPEQALIRELAPSHLLHLAWCTRPGVFWTSPENLDWVQASLRLLRAFTEHGGRRAVIAGTCTEYAWERVTHCVEEIPARVPTQNGGARAGLARAAPPTSLRPETLYGVAKHALHMLAESWAAQTDIALAWGRVFYVYGPHEHPDRLVSGVARALLRGEEARCTSGTQVRDYMYSPDLGGAFAALLSSEVTGPVNMASGMPVSVAEVVKAIAAAAGRPELVRLGALPQRPGESERLTADVGRLHEDVGWLPSVDLHEGAARTVEWWRGALT
jgi:nucleoside-diphosphate-sugar epimerase